MKNITLFKSFILRDLAIERAYRFDLLTKALSVFAQIALFYFIAAYMKTPSYFTFVLSGMIFSRIFVFFVNTTAENIRQEQYYTTAEQLFLSPHQPVKIVLFSVSGKLLMLAAEICVYLLIGIFVFGAAFKISIAGLLFALVVNTAMFLGFGLMSAAFVVKYKRGDPINWVVTALFDLVSGVYFPIAVFPLWLSSISKYLPTTVGLEIWRSAILNSVFFPDFKKAVYVFVWSAVSILIGLAFFRKALASAKKSGEVGSY